MAQLYFEVTFVMFILLHLKTKYQIALFLFMLLLQFEKRRGQAASSFFELWHHQISKHINLVFRYYFVLRHWPADVLLRFKYVPRETKEVNMRLHTYIFSAFIFFQDLTLTVALSRLNNFQSVTASISKKILSKS